MFEPCEQPRIPGPGELGPDPEALGTERFVRLMSRLEMHPPLPPEALVMPVPLDPHRREPRFPDQAAA